jgi:hypothetical protein
MECDQAELNETTRRPNGNNFRNCTVRRVSDRILVAFHDACDYGDLDVARRLLDVLEMILTHEPTFTSRRRDIDSLVMAHERLWHLRHPAPDEYRTLG